MKVFYSLFLFVICACSSSKDSTIITPNEPQPNSPGEEKNYLALGDSYTIGESVEESARWPVQLTQSLNQHIDVQLTSPTIVAQTGWTTDELQSAIETTSLAESYDLVTLLIGVNNQYRGYEFSQFEREFEDLLDFAIEKAGSPTHVIVVSIPDWGVMPFAEGRDREQIASEIDQYNQTKKEITDEKGAQYVNITDISRNVGDHPEYIAGDGLHPSGEQYAEWVERIIPIAKSILQ